ncbi:hypothetical protein [Sphingomonas sp. Leaf62]|uniref:hypothetical protein n=1 Tax=Sphingomonas sp. Leaf62 TaxID=1736228 RepID=UPI0007002207|nr:hypothetical protein [Sphingomonas sp. Leaf62]KQN71466.1 hypothetical protein ASE91_06195 [Sphingomonas sp. Leaf62]
MPDRAPPIYRRGKYWLDWDRRADGTSRSPYLTIFWYDVGARRVRSASTRATDEGDAILALDRRYLSDASESPAFCQACGQPIAKGEQYLLTDAIADYRLEWGDNRASACAIEMRLNHTLDFLESQDTTGGKFGIGTTCAVACTTSFANALREWSKAQPVVWRNGDGEITKSRPRSPAATETVIAQTAAALNHAANADPPRSDKRPTYKPLPAKQVQRTRRSRIGVPDLARMVAYAAADPMRASLHAFLIGSICTIARPGAVVDICVAPERNQWMPGSETIDLNPVGRVQNKKVRPLLPVLPLLAHWLQAEWVSYDQLPVNERVGRGYLVNYYGRPIRNVARAWDTMLAELKLPTGREWQQYILRHSLATIVRKRGATAWDLQGYMGHLLPSQTEIYAEGDFASVQTALQSVIDELEQLAPGALHRTNTGEAAAPSRGGRSKMSG